MAGAYPTPDGIPSVINRASCIALSKSLGMSLPKDNILVNDAMKARVAAAAAAVARDAA